MPFRLERTALYFALLVAWVAMLGSLYFSEVRHYIPCTWCWYQRILMYPIALVLAVGLLRRDAQVPFYSATFSLIGIAASTYHYLLQKTDWFSESTACTGAVPCSFDYINWLGFITIPFLALIAFTLIFFASIIALTGQPAFEEETEKRAPLLPVFGIIAAVVLVFTPSFLNAEPPPPTTNVLNDLPAASINTEGADLYRDACSGCHGPAGEGVARLGTPLVDTEWTDSATTDEWITLVREGIPADHPDNETGVAMPPSGGRPDLSDAELTSILHYLHSLSPSSQEQ
jgi:disulfide bond formation protein DsbB/mono/diheme cytochrome c family protein